MKIIDMISPEQRQSKRCYFCGTNLSVKYIVEVFDPVMANEPSRVCVCNKCVLHFSGRQISILREV